MITILSNHPTRFSTSDPAECDDCGEEVTTLTDTIAGYLCDRCNARFANACQGLASRHNRHSEAEMNKGGDVVSCPNSPVGNCINCGHRLTFCGKPFTADVECSKCFKINHYRNSQQPVHTSDMDSLVHV